MTEKLGGLGVCPRNCASEIRPRSSAPQPKWRRSVNAHYGCPTSEDHCSRTSTGSSR